MIMAELLRKNTWWPLQKKLCSFRMRVKDTIRRQLPFNVKGLVASNLWEKIDQKSSDGILGDRKAKRKLVGGWTNPSEKY